MVCPPILCPEAEEGQGIWWTGGLFQTLRGGTGHMGWLPTATGRRPTGHRPSVVTISEAEQRGTWRMEVT